MNWRDQAACRDVDTDLFFPDKGAQAPVVVREAKKVCAVCPVREDCLNAAVAAREKFGVWGGLTPKERRRLPAHESRERWLAGIAQRRADARRLAASGVTHEVIARRLQVSVCTVRHDLYSAKSEGAA